VAKVDPSPNLFDYSHLNDDEFNSTQERNYHLKKKFHNVSKKIEKQTREIEGDMMFEMYTQSHQIKFVSGLLTMVEG
jgi:hypothetical protein